MAQSYFEVVLALCVTALIFLVGIHAALFLIITRRETKMAQVADLQSSMDALTAGFQKLAAAYRAQQGSGGTGGGGTTVTGIDPAALDPIKQQMDNLATAVNELVDGPAPTT